METADMEVTQEVCIRGEGTLLNPAARGWGRHPYWIDNLRGRFPRKKRWDYWCFMGPERLYSFCIANVDYIGLIGVYVLEYATGRFGECGTVRPFSRQPVMPPRTVGRAALRFGRIEAEQELDEGGGTLRFTAPNCAGKPLHALMHVETPPAQETLNVLVPWSERLYQFTSKQVPLPAWGEVRWGDEVWTFDRASTFGVRDYGRGIWPYQTNWNWAALSAVDSGRVYGVNLGGQWTDGTGATENGLIVDGVLYKIHEDVTFEYDRSDFMKPWRLYTKGSNTLDLVLTPFYDKHSHANLGIMKSTVHQCFGRFHGCVQTGGQRVDVDGALGWSEEQCARW
ncbi:MAG: hypothetical protein RLZZ303_221 [Candidatus Hydrogenedentota bacterium]|jgi:hypothetical protein